MIGSVEDAGAALLAVPEITMAEPARPGEAGERLLLLDLREPSEFARSRIPGAIHVPPGASAGAELARHGSRVASATVVLYCAVVWPSGRMLRGMRQVAACAPAASLLNLRGGIFRWHAEGCALELAPGAAVVRHFDTIWARLLRRMMDR